MYARFVANKLEEALNFRRVVAIVGARQCGKTTLAKQFVQDSIYYTLDNPNTLQAALDDPISFVQKNKRTLIIDEVQKAPKLLSAIKMKVDEDNTNGQYIITGSANIQSLPEVGESLAGRISNIRLRTLSQAEILGNKPNFLDKFFSGNFSYENSTCTKANILELAFCGGYPEAVRLSKKHRRAWHLDYLNSLLKKDLRDIAQIHRQDILQKLVEILASWSSKFMDYNAICGELSVSRQTFESYRNALSNLYLFEKLPPWLNTDYERVGKKEKWFITDTGLMTSVLNWKQDDIMLDADKLGKLIESFVYNELMVQVELSNEHRIYQYRDREKREIDFIIENSKGDIVGIEVKSSATVDKNDFKHLKWFRDNLVKDKYTQCIVLYAGEQTLSFGEGLLAVPITEIWD